MCQASPEYMCSVTTTPTYGAAAEECHVLRIYVLLYQYVRLGEDLGGEQNDSLATCFCLVGLRSKKI